MTLKKKVLAVFLVAAILCTSLVTMAGAVNVENFTDVSSSDWFYEYVDFVSKKDYMIGVSETEFAPQNNMTRAIFVTVLSRIDKAEVDNSVSVFDDVPAGTWYTGAVAWAYKNGITTGTSTTTFSPNAPVTREQMSAFIARFVDYYAKENSLTHKSNGTLDAFTDDDQIAAYAKVSVDRARKWGLIIGFPDGSFRPTDYSTRAQVAAVVSRLDWLVNPTGGGGGGYVPPAPAAKNYDVIVNLNAALPGQTPKALTLKASYTGITTSNDVALNTIAGDLIKNNGTPTTNNKDILDNAITYAMSQVKGKSFTRTVGGETFTVTLSTDGTLTSTVTAAALLSKGATTGGYASIPSLKFATASVAPISIMADAYDYTQADYEALIELLQNSDGNISLTAEQIEVLVELIERCDEVAGMTDAEIEARLDKYAESFDEAIQSAIDNLSVEDVKKAVAEYKETLEDIVDDLEDAGVVINPDGTVVATTVPAGGVNVAVEPVVVTVNVDLNVYYTELETKYNAKKATAVANFATKMGITDGSIDTAAGNLYDVFAPSKLVNVTGGVVSMKTADDYYNVLKDGVEKSIALWQALNKDSTYYTGKIADATTKAATYSATVTNDALLAQALGSQSSNILSMFTADTTVLTVTGNANQTAWTNALNYVNSFSLSATLQNLINYFNTIPSKINGATYTATIDVDVK